MARTPASSADPFDVGVFTQWVPARMRPSSQWSVKRRAAVAATVAWLPLAALSIAHGLLHQSFARESVLLDITVYARYLVAIPLLVVADALTLPQLAAIARHFVNAGIVPGHERARYDAVIESVRRLLGRRIAAPGLIALAYAAAGYRLVYAAEHGGLLAPRRESWFAVVVDGDRAITLAGWWVMLISQPLFLFLAGLWAWRLVAWTRFLWGMSRLDLQLVPAHPDGAAGLYFTAGSLRAFAFVAMAVSAAFAGVIAEEVLEFGRPADAFSYVVLGAVGVVMVIFVAPLFVFAGVLRRVRLQGPLMYGGLAVTVGRVFEARWMRPDAPIGESLSQTDFSAMIDLYSIAANAQRIKPVPLGLGPLATLAFGTLLPYLLVAIVALPIDRILRVVQALLL